jgi:DHA2 family multidrug resistance protein
MMETLMGYPVVTTGLVTAPRGVGSLISMFLVGQLIRRVDPRLIILTGLIISAGALYGMTRFSLQMDSALFIWTGLFQGVGIGLIFVPLTTLAFATLTPSLRADGAGVFTLVRNLGSSAGISIMQALHTSNTQIIHSGMIEHLRPDNPVARAPWLAAPFSLTQPTGVALLNGEVGRQASMIAYIDDFRLMLFVALALAPVLLLMRRPPRGRNHEPVLAD